MEIEKTLKLIEAGFTADEIRAMLSQPEKAPVNPAPEKAPEPEEKAQAPEAAPVKEDPAPAEDPYKEAFEAINKQIADITANVNKITKMAFMPSMEDVKPLGIEDVISNFFKEV